MTIKFVHVFSREIQRTTRHSQRVRESGLSFVKLKQGDFNAGDGCFLMPTKMGVIMGVELLSVLCVHLLMLQSYVLGGKIKK